MIEQRLEQTFRHIAETRMAGLPILNEALGIEAIGFRAWEGETYGVLVTPWFMNLVCLPGESSDWPRMTSGTKYPRDLPAGRFDFLSAEEEGIGPFLGCSLFSPMSDFADMASARAVAEEVIAQVFKAPAPETPAPSRRLEQPVSRRGFLSALLPRERQP